MAAEDWEQFFYDNAAPTGLRELEATISSFLARQADRRVCLVTSGGTTVPLELNTVRQARSSHGHLKMSYQESTAL